MVMPRGAARIDACIKIDCGFQTLMAKQLFDQLEGARRVVEQDFRS